MDMLTKAMNGAAIVAGNMAAEHERKCREAALAAHTDEDSLGSMLIAGGGSDSS